ncbi:MAG: MFS transporter [Pseudomonadota bacterium]
MKTAERGFFAGFSGAEKRLVFLAALIAMLRMFGVFALLPVLSVYAASLDKATPLLIGLAVGAYGLTQAGMQIPLGMLSDRIGRVPVIAAALLLLAAGSVMAAVSDTIYGVIAGRLLQGAGAISAALVAYIADGTRESVRTRSMALYGIGFGVAFMVAVIAGPVIAAQFGVLGVFWGAAIAALFAVGTLFLLPAVERPKRRAVAGFSLRPALKPELLRLDLYVFLLHAILTASFVALPFLFSQRLELPMTSHWTMYLGALLASLVVTVPLIVKDDRQGKTAYLSFAVGLILCAQLVFAFAGFSTLAVAAGLALFFGGFNFLEAGLPARLSSKAVEAERGASLGVFSTAQFLGIFTGGLLGGQFLTAGTTGVFLLCAGLAAGWLLLAGTAGGEESKAVAADQ